MLNILMHPFHMLGNMSASIFGKIIPISLVFSIVFQEIFPEFETRLYGEHSLCFSSIGPNPYSLIFFQNFFCMKSSPESGVGEQSKKNNPVLHLKGTSTIARSIPDSLSKKQQMLFWTISKCFSSIITT